MTQEEKAKAYDEALKKARMYRDNAIEVEEYSAVARYENIFPELAESDDERMIRKIQIKLLALWKQYAEENDAERDIKSISDALAYFEKQEAQKPVDPSDDELQRHQDELYDFKVFATKQAKEHHISFVRDFEWNNFCAELLSYFAEQKPAECSKKINVDEMVAHYACTEQEGFGKPVNCMVKAYKQGILDILKSTKPAEWSEEDESMLERIIHQYEEANDLASKQKASFSYNAELRFLKSLRPQPCWKPSEEQMGALHKAMSLLSYNGIVLKAANRNPLLSLYNDLKKL